MPETVLRQWEMLRAIPRSPKKVSVGDLLRTLESAGFRTTKRTIQRELNHLSTIFPLQSDERSIPYGWSWAPRAPVFDLPAMDATTALSLRMIEEFLTGLIPPTVWEALRPQFRRAEALLKAYGPEGLDRWTSIVRVVPKEMPLLPPAVNDDAVRAIYQALLESKRIEVRYAPRFGEAAEKSYLVSPLGLVARGAVIYLVCTLWDYADIRQLVLHRVLAASPTAEPVLRPEGFELDAYIRSGAFQYPIGPAISLCAKFERGAAAHLCETALSVDQVIENIDENHVLVKATVLDTSQLEWWLLGFGDLVEVIEPATLRDRVRACVARAAGAYTSAHRPD